MLLIVFEKFGSNLITSVIDKYKAEQRKDNNHSVVVVNVCMYNCQNNIKISQWRV